jgi:rhodanese-related sulfurtransferase
VKVSPEEAHRLMEDEGFVYLDVRSVPEFAEGRPRGAVNVPIAHMTVTGLAPNASFVADVRTRFPDPMTPLVVGCKAGGRSARAVELLAAAGYTRLHDQRAGWDGARGVFGEITEPGWRRTSLPREP